MPAVGHFVGPEAYTRYLRDYEAAQSLMPPVRDQRDVETAFGSVRTYRYGPAEGPPVILLHGLMATSAMWAPNIERFARHHPVFTLDSLGEPGRSVQAVPLRTSADQARWLGEVLAALGLDAAHLVGVSAGGWLAFNLAAHDPRRLASVSLLEPAAVLAPFAKRFLAAALARRFLVAAVPAAEAVSNRWFLRWVSGAPPEGPLGRVLEAGMAAYRTQLPLFRLPSDDVLRAVRVPVLALLGGRSVGHDAARAAERARLLPHAEVEVWDDATHALSAQAADRVTDRVLRFIAAAEGSARTTDVTPDRR